MKTQVLIIEDNPYKYFTTKQVLGCQLRLPINSLDVADNHDLCMKALELRPDLILYRPQGGVADLLQQLKKRRTNRRNTEITVILAQDLDEAAVERLQEACSGDAPRMAKAA